MQLWATVKQGSLNLPFPHVIFVRTHYCVICELTAVCHLCFIIHLLLFFSTSSFPCHFFLAFSLSSDFAELIIYKEIVQRKWSKAGYLG
jgi:ABC-type microcin C transport system permease subunit YejB